MRFPFPLFLLAACATTQSTTALPADTEPQDPSMRVMYAAEVLDCYDGDTCTVNIVTGVAVTPMGLDVEVATVVRLVRQTIRLCDVDTPEMQGATKAAAVEARTALIEWIQSSHKIEVQLLQYPCEAGRRPSTCGKKDSFRRWLAYLYADGENLNQRLLSTGHAVPYRKKCK